MWAQNAEFFERLLILTPMHFLPQNFHTSISLASYVSLIVNWLFLIISSYKQSYEKNHFLLPSMIDSHILSVYIHVTRCVNLVWLKALSRQQKFFCNVSAYGRFFITFWKNSCFEVFGPKEAQNGPKMRLFMFYRKFNSWNFPDFCMKLQYHKDLKLTWACFWWLFLCFWAKRNPEWVKDEVFQVL